MKITVGTTLIIEHGSYSDRDWDGPFRAVKEFDRDEITSERF